MITEEVYEKAMERFNYNPLTGDIIYIEDTKKCNIGDVANCDNGRGYIQIPVIIHGKQKNVTAHRLAFYIMGGYLPDAVDHIDGDPSNNKWLNLRGCTRAENMRNLGINKANTSGYRGVSRHYDKWRGNVILNGKFHTKSGFSTPELANDWAVAKSKELYGEFYNEGR